MTQALLFAEVVEAADRLTRDEQEELVAILHRRLAQAARERIAAEVKEGRAELANGSCFPATPGELMREILK